MCCRACIAVSFFPTLDDKTNSPHIPELRQVAMQYKITKVIKKDKSDEINIATKSLMVSVFRIYELSNW